MAIFHLNVTPISRGGGRSATAASAYRSATKIVDERTGETHDYTAKRGVDHSAIVLPSSLAGVAPDWAASRARLWNAAERAEVREDGRVAREVEVALPAELSKDERRILTQAFARSLADRYQVAVDVAIHRPHKEGDVRNHHAHLLLTTRVATLAGLTVKTPIELSDTKRAKLGLHSGRKEITALRASWSQLANEHLKQAGHEASIDHRSLAEQGIERTPTKHFGPVVAERLRRGKDSYVAERIRQERVVDANERLARAAEIGRLEREGRGVAQAILDTESSLSAALAARSRTAAARVAPAPEHDSITPTQPRELAQTLWLEQRHASPGQAPDRNPDRQLILDPGTDRSPARHEPRAPVR